LAQVFCSATATLKQSFSLSMTHGPAIRMNRRPELSSFQRFEVALDTAVFYQEEEAM